MRPYALAAIVLLMFLPLAQADAQSWGAEGKPAPGAVTVPVEVEVVADTSLAAAASDVATSKRRGLSRSQKKALGLTWPGIVKTVLAIHADGELAGRDVETVAADVFSRSIVKNPKAYMDASVGVDDEFWMRVLEWLEKILPAILFFMSLLS